MVSPSLSLSDRSQIPSPSKSGPSLFTLGPGASRVAFVQSSHPSWSTSPQIFASSGLGSMVSITLSSSQSPSVSVSIPAPWSHSIVSIDPSLSQSPSTSVLSPRPDHIRSHRALHHSLGRRRSLRRCCHYSHRLNRYHKSHPLDSVRLGSHRSAFG